MYMKSSIYRISRVLVSIEALPPLSELPPSTCHWQLGSHRSQSPSQNSAHIDSQLVSFLLTSAATHVPG